jgi:hypothetical protein
MSKDQRVIVLSGQITDLKMMRIDPRHSLPNWGPMTLYDLDTADFQSGLRASDNRHRRSSLPRNRNRRCTSQLAGLQRKEGRTVYNTNMYAASRQGANGLDCTVAGLCTSMKAVHQMTHPPQAMIMNMALRQVVGSGLCLIMPLRNKRMSLHAVGPSGRHQHLPVAGRKEWRGLGGITVTRSRTNMKLIYGQTLKYAHARLSAPNPDRNFTYHL